jgi:ferredoxin-NADP reductase
VESTTALRTVVRSRRLVADGVVEVTLGRPDATPLPSWDAGAHIDLVLSPDVVRQYTLCGRTEAKDTYTIAIRRDDHGRGGSVLAYESLVPGAQVEVRAPRNHFPLVRAAAYVFVAGGIGITPMVSLIDATAVTGKPWRLVYTGRSRSRMAYVDELCDRYPGRIEVHDSQSGRIDITAALGALAPGTAVYCCGPAALIEAAARHCEPQNAVDVFTERFVPREAGAPVRTESFDVEFAVSGRTLTIQPAQSILDAAESNGIVVVASCREGTCGTCETAVISGQIEHRDSVLTPEECAEGESMMVCVSRAAGPRLVLEL